MARTLSNQVSRHTTTQGAVIPTVVHVTQGSAPESDRHPQNSPTLDGNEERNGCVAQMDMPLNHAAVTADESRASADEIQDGERHSEGSELDHSSDLGGHSRYTRALVQPEGPSCGDEASSALYRGIVMVETREAHNLEVAGSNPAPATSSIQHSQPTETSGLGAAVSASAGSYGETAPCTETAGAEIPTESGCSAVRDERVYTSHTAARFHSRRRRSQNINTLLPEKYGHCRR